ncbi:hypothetical protein LTR08_008549 [Meristemomyces frigidus]|nr:hypothetical protein LTR08_008549 [Meristemomyces frigidus]
MARDLALYLALQSLVCVASSLGIPPADSHTEIISRDVCIIGGGSSGTYSAIRLQQMNKSVALIERQDRLGGHVNTYVDPTSNKTFDYGVIIYDNTSLVTDYLGHLDVPVVSANSLFGGITLSADFATGAVLPASAANETSLGAALLAYLDQLAKYPYLVNGFNLPDPVPDDLLLTWGDFLDKYQLGAMAFVSFQYNQGAGNTLAQQTLYMLKYFPAATVQSLLTGGFITTAHHANQQIYDSALAKLGSDALICSNVTKIIRGSDGVEVHVSTPTGTRLIKASKLLVTIPPKLSNLGFLDLDFQERSLFGQFNNSYYWDAVLKNSGIPDNTSFSNVDPAAPYAIPPMPGVYSYGATGFQGLHSVYYSSPHAMSDGEVKAEILDANARLVQSLGYPQMQPSFVGFNAHNPFLLTVSADDIKNGFYTKLEGLQGQKSTWWTGATWQTQDSSAIWAFTEDLILPKLAA